MQVSLGLVSGLELGLGLGLGSGLELGLGLGLGSLSYFFVIAVSCFIFYVEWCIR